MLDFSNYLLDLFGLPEVVDLNQVNGTDVYSALIEKYKSKFKNIIDIFKKETGYIIVRTTEYNLKRGIMLVDIKKDIEALRKGLKEHQLQPQQTRMANKERSYVQFHLQRSSGCRTKAKLELPIQSPS